MALINLEINLNEVFKGSIVEKDGKKYVCLTTLKGHHIYQNENKGTTNLKLVVAERKEPSKFGQTHTVILSKPKEQTDKIYIGDGKAYNFNQQHQQQQQQPNSNNFEPVDDLPF